MMTAYAAAYWATCGLKRFLEQLSTFRESNFKCDVLIAQLINVIFHRCKEHDFSCSMIHFLCYFNKIAQTYMGL